jgi:hypothetical protein
VVSAEDVQSSLYYLHVHGPQDQQLLRDPPLEEPGDDLDVVEAAPAALGPVPSIARKPLPKSPLAFSAISTLKSARPLPQTPPEVPVRPSPANGHGRLSSDLARPSLSVLTPRDNVVNRHNLAAGHYQHALTPPPSANLLPDGSRSSPSIRNLEQLVHRSNENQRHLEDILNDLSIEATPGAESLGQRRQKDTRPPLPKRPSVQTMTSRSSNAEGTCLTLIRRDPSSNQQWNVAEITDPPVFDISSDTQGTKKIGQPIYISISNPGYAKFDKSTLPRRSLDESVEIPRTPSAASSAESAVQTSDATFHRRLWMQGSTFSSNFSRHQKSISADSLPPYDPSTPRLPNLSARTSSDSSRPSLEPRMHTISLTGAERSKTKNYTFLSPWHGGRCEFSTSGIGGSLRCRHSFTSQYLSVDGRNEPVTVSELRFNLPGGGPLASSTVDDTSSASSLKLKPRRSPRRLLRGLHQRGNSDNYIPAYAGEEDRLDLTLGQELAGGGVTGKKAKVGKLIVYAEGCKMLDLLVAANMAVWWRAWDKC